MTERSTISSSADRASGAGPELARVRLSGDDTEEAADAFDGLSREGRNVVDRFLHYSCRVQDLHDRADVAQAVAGRIWSARRRITDQGPAAWAGHLRRCAYRRYVDLLRGHGLVVGLEEMERRGVPPEERRDIEAVAVASAEPGRVWRVADTLWLGVDHIAAPQSGRSDGAL